MTYTNPQVAQTADLLKQRLNNAANKSDILKAVELRALYDQIKLLSDDQKASFGAEVNSLRQELITLINAEEDTPEALLPPIDLTAPYDLNDTPATRPRLLPSEDGSAHPLMTELSTVLDIFYRMGFSVVESPEIDDDYHMFEALNFPENHPARDDYDTFMTVQTGKDDKPFIAPAHTSTMQHRVIKQHKNILENNDIAVVIPGRVFRNEDLDARHEHTFYQLEGVYVGKNINVGNLIATLKTFLQEYYSKQLDVKTQPFYFPFTEPSFEFVLSCPFCDKVGCSICSQSGWIELLGCGMIHPNVLSEAGVDPEVYSGFAWGFGIERLVMMKYGIDDIRYFKSAKLDFLRQFA